MDNSSWQIISLLCLLWLAALQTSLARDINITLHGDLVDDACDVNINSTDMLVDFGQLFFQDFYKKDTVISKPLSIQLENCDTAIAKAVVVKFMGETDKTITGALAVDGISGIAIQLMTTDGQLINLQQDQPEFMLQQGKMTLNFISVIKPYPLVDGKSPVTPGKFQAMLVFDLSYP